MMFSRVLLPQPEWPMVAISSPSATVRLTSFRTQTGFVPPAWAGKTFETLSICRYSPMTSLRVFDEPSDALEAQVEKHAQDADDENAEQHPRQVRRVPVVPAEIPDTQLTQQHLGRHDRDQSAA